MGRHFHWPLLFLLGLHGVRLRVLSLSCGNVCGEVRVSKRARRWWILWHACTHATRARASASFVLWPRPPRAPPQKRAHHEAARARGLGFAPALGSDAHACARLSRGCALPVHRVRCDRQRSPSAADDAGRNVRRRPAQAVGTWHSHRARLACSPPHPQPQTGSQAPAAAPRGEGRGPGLAISIEHQGRQSRWVHRAG